MVEKIVYHRHEGESSQRPLKRSRLNKISRTDLPCEGWGTREGERREGDKEDQEVEMTGLHRKGKLRGGKGRTVGGGL